MKLFKKLAALALTAALAFTLLAGCSGSPADTPEQLVMNRINAQRKLYGKETSIQNDPELQQLGAEILETVTTKGEQLDRQRLNTFFTAPFIAAIGDKPVYYLDLEKFKQIQPSVANRVSWGYSWQIGLGAEMKSILNAPKGTIALVGYGVALCELPDELVEGSAVRQQVTVGYPFESKQWEKDIDEGGAAWSMLDKVGFATKEVDGALRYIILVEVT